MSHFTTNGFDFLVGSPSFVIGWGVSNITWVRIRRNRIDRVLHFKDKLQVLAMIFLDRRQCEKAYNLGGKKMGPDHICLGSNALRKDTCDVIEV